MRILSYNALTVKRDKSIFTLIFTTFKLYLLKLLEDLELRMLSLYSLIFSVPSLDHHILLCTGSSGDKGKGEKEESNNNPDDDSSHNTDKGKAPQEKPEDNPDDKATQEQSDSSKEDTPPRILDKGKGRATEYEADYYTDRNFRFNYPVKSKDNFYENDSDSEYERQVKRTKLASFYAEKEGESSKPNPWLGYSTSNQIAESSKSNQIPGPSTLNPIPGPSTSNQIDESSKNSSEYRPTDLELIESLACLEDEKKYIAKVHNEVRSQANEAVNPEETNEILTNLKNKHEENANDIDIIKGKLKERGIITETFDYGSSSEGSYENSEYSSDEANEPNKRVKLADQDNKRLFILPITREFIFSFSPVINLFFSAICLYVVCYIYIEPFEFYTFYIDTAYLLSLYLAINTFKLIWKQYHNMIKLYHGFCNKDYLHSPWRFALLFLACTILFIYKAIKLFVW